MDRTKSVEVAGLETIVGLTGSPPKTIKLPYSLVHSEELLRQAWNARYIAILPYCFVCKQVLVWHSPPNEDDHILFHCPSCKREWVLDDNWEREKSTKKKAEVVEV